MFNTVEGTSTTGNGNTMTHLMTKDAVIINLIITIISGYPTCSVTVSVLTYNSKALSSIPGGIEIKYYSVMRSQDYIDN